ncbi:MAG TPA: NnrS family protein [Burkholderiales bacterium]|nr:NnrS family protein [Burkholderiales bacterium]
MKRIAGNAVFFPAAAAYAVLVLPASMYSMTGHIEALPGLASPAGHAHEMLFGFALAVVAGNQLGPSGIARLAGLLGFWALARAIFVLAPQSIAAAAANAAFAALLALQLAPRLLGAAKKLRNQALPVALIAICAAAAAFPLAPHADVMVAVLLFALLMLFMGGRIIAPAVAGQYYRQGAKLDARVQPAIEAGLIAGMALAVGSAIWGRPGFGWLTAAATGACGLLAAARLWRWRLWGLRGRPDLLCLAAGYGWVALGLVLYAAALAAGQERTAALHLITVGGLGTLTLNVMAMTSMLKARLEPSRARIPVWGTLLIAAATLARAQAGESALASPEWLWFAALCWSSAFALLLVLLMRCARAASTAKRIRAA